MTSLQAADLRDRAAALHPSEGEARAWLLGEAKGWDDAMAWLGEDAQRQAVARTFVSTRTYTIATSGAGEYPMHRVTAARDEWHRALRKAHTALGALTHHEPRA